MPDNPAHPLANVLMKAEETGYFALLPIIFSLTLLFWSCRVRGTLSKRAGEKSGDGWGRNTS
jgi:hypothetical protein